MKNYLHNIWKLLGLGLLALSACQSPVSEPAKAPVPSAVTNLAATAGDGKAVVTWTPVSNATSYNLYWSSSATLTTANGTKVTSATSPYTLNGLTNQTQYYLLATGVNSSGEGAVSSVVSVTPVGPVVDNNPTVAPQAPSQISAVSGDGQITLSWPSVLSADSYNIYWQTAADVQKATATKASSLLHSFTIPSLKNGTVYYYAVTAVNKAGESKLSPELSSAPAAAQAGAPAGFIATAGNTNNLLTWQAVTGATSYNIYWSTNSALTVATGTKISGLATLNYTHANLVNGVSYYYILTAVTASGESGPSAVSSAGPQAPAGSASAIVAAATGTQATLSWQPVTGATAYNVYWSTSGNLSPSNSTKIPNLQSTAYTHVGLVPGATYYYILTSVSSNKESLPSLPVSVVVPTAVPTGFSAAATGQTQTTMSWSAVPGAASYNLYWSTNLGVTPQNGTEIANITGTTYVHNGLSSGTNYYYIVTSVGAGGESLPSVEASANTAAATPLPPSNLKVTPSATQNTVTWDPVPGASGYNVYWSASFGVNTQTGTKVSGVNMNLYNHTGLTQGTTAYYIVTSVGPGGESAPTVQASGTTTPAAPKNLSITSALGQNSLTWQTVPGATSYSLYWSSSFIVKLSNSNVIKNLQTNSYLHNQLQSGASYYYVVVAVNDAGESVISNQVNATVPYPVPGVPNNVTAAGSIGQVALSWESVTGASSYTVYWSNQPNVSPSTGQKVAGIQGTSFLHQGLTGGSVYYYVVTATTLGGESVASAQATATPVIPPPGTPNLSTPVPGVGTMTLNWAALPNVTSYNLYWSTQASVSPATGTKIGNLQGTSYTQRNLSPGTSIFYVLTSMGSGGESAPCSVVSGTVAYPATPVPSNLTASAGVGLINLTWDAVPNATSYNVYWSQSPSVAPGNAMKVAVNTPNYSHTGLVSGQSYYYVVSALGPGGESLATAVVSTSVLYAVPGVPSSLTATAGAGSVSLTWQAVGNASSYNVYWSTTPGVTTGTGNKIPFIQGASFTHGGLVQGMTYYYIVSAVSAGGESAPSAQVTMTTLVTPSIPSLVTVSAAVGTNTVSWAPAPGALSYNLYWSNQATVAPGNGNKITNINGTSYLHAGLVSGQAYYYVITAVGTGGESGASASTSATVLYPVAASPSGLVATAGVGQVQLSWAPVTNASGYNIYWSTTPGLTVGNGVQVSGIKNASYTHAGLIQGQTYYYLVTAASPGGESQPTAVVQTNTLILPTAPTGVSATPLVGLVQLSWTAVLGANSYTLYWSSSPTVAPGNGTKVPGIGTTSFDLTGLVSGQTYYFALTANGGGGESSGSSVTSATVLSPPPPIPGGFIANGGPANAILSWAPSEGAKSYNVYWSSNNGVTTANGTKVSGLTGTSYQISGLTAGNSYYFIVTAVGVGGESAASSQTSAVAQTPPPGAPSNLLAVGQISQITLSWGSVPGSLGYNVYWSQSPTVAIGNGNKITLGTSTGYVHSGLPSGSTYYYVVSSVNGAGESPASNLATANVVYPVPPAPSALVANSLVGASSISWTAGGASPLVTGYNLYWQTTPGVTPGTGNKISLTGTAYNHTSLVQGLTYYYTVTSTGPGGESAPTTATSTTTLWLPDVPTGLTVNSASDGRATVSWSAVTKPAGQSVTYNVWWSISGSVAKGNGTLVSAGSSTSVVINGLANGTTYYFVVTAVGSGGESSSSNTVGNQVPYPPPMAPTGLVVTPEAGGGPLDLGWNGVTGATSYKIYWSATPGVSVGAGTFLTAITNAYGGGVPPVAFKHSSGIQAGQTYYYVVTAVGPGGEGAPSQEASGKVTIPPPPAPILQSVTPTLLSTSTPKWLGKNTLTWTAVSGATGYNIYWTAVSGSAPMLTPGGGTKVTVGAAVPGATTVSFDLEGLINGANYYYIVCAVNGGGEGGASNQLNGQIPLAPPPAPGIVAVSGGISNLMVSWNASLGAQTYNVYLSTSSNVSPSAGNRYGPYSGTTTTIASLVPGQTYYAVVTGVNPTGGEGDPSGALSSKILFPLPSVPTISVISGPDPANIQISWSTEANMATTLEYSTTGYSGWTALAATNGVETELLPYNAGQQYYFHVTATNPDGISATSTVAPGSVRLPLQAPAPTTSRNTPGFLKLDWGSVSGANSYNIYYGGSNLDVTKPATYQIISGLTSLSYTFGSPQGMVYPNTYYFAVEAVGTLTTKVSGVVSGVPRALPPPTPTIAPHGGSDKLGADYLSGEFWNDSNYVIPDLVDSVGYEIWDQDKAVLITSSSGLSKTDNYGASWWRPAGSGHASSWGDHKVVGNWGSPRAGGTNGPTWIRYFYKNESGTSAPGPWSQLNYSSTSYYSW